MLDEEKTETENRQPRVPLNKEAGNGISVAAPQDALADARSGFLSLPAQDQYKLFAELGGYLLLRNDPVAVETIRRLAEQAKTAQSRLLGADHPLAGVAGSFKDDPEWDEMMEAVQNYRRRIDSDDARPE